MANCRTGTHRAVHRRASYANALAFRLFGVDLLAIRYMLFGIVPALASALYYVARGWRSARRGAVTLWAGAGACPISGGHAVVVQPLILATSDSRRFGLHRKCRGAAGSCWPAGLVGSRSSAR